MVGKLTFGKTGLLIRDIALCNDLCLLQSLGSFFIMVEANRRAMVGNYVGFLNSIAIIYQKSC